MLPVEEDWNWELGEEVVDDGREYSDARMLNWSHEYHSRVLGSPFEVCVRIRGNSLRRVISLFNFSLIGEMTVISDFLQI